MTWKPFAEVEAELGTRLHRKVSAGALPTYTDGRGQRFVWMHQGAPSLDDVLWDVLAELRTVRAALERLERQAAVSAAASAVLPAVGDGSKIISLRARRPRPPELGPEGLLALAEEARARLGISERELLRRAELSDPAFLCKARRGLKREPAARATWARLAAYLTGPPSTSSAVERAA